jgi:hypothetical protein
MRSPSPENNVVALALILHDLQRRLEQDRRAEDLPPLLRKFCATPSDLKRLVWSDEGEISTVPGCSPVTSPPSSTCLEL